MAGAVSQLAFSVRLNALSNASGKGLAAIVLGFSWPLCEVIRALNRT
jgi:hypothetical protein